MQWGSANEYKTLVAHLEELVAIGLRSVMLFGVVTNEHKDDQGSWSLKTETPVIVVTRILRKVLPKLMVMCDVCLCEYTSNGHCGMLKETGFVEGDVIDNKPSVDILAKTALSYAKAGAHWVCPSDMMDGRVKAIRQVLDESGFEHVGIMSYTSKKASTMYAPFRAAVDSTFTGDRKRYQQPCGSVSHSLQALDRDIAEGASVVLVKPALFYGDIIRQFKQRCNLPIACYVVSGEYVMLQDYAKRAGDLKAVLRESHIGLIRAGASILITYFTPILLQMIKDGQI